MVCVRLCPQCVKATTGNAGLRTQVLGLAVTVTGMAEATGGVAAGNFIKTDS